MLKAMPTVAPMVVPIPVTVVSTRFSLVTKKTRYAETAVDGVCKAMEMMVTATAPITIRKVILSRPGNGASSRRSQGSHVERCRGVKVWERKVIRSMRDGRPLDDGDG